MLRIVLISLIRLRKLTIWWYERASYRSGSSAPSRPAPKSPLMYLPESHPKQRLAATSISVAPALPECHPILVRTSQWPRRARGPRRGAPSPLDWRRARCRRLTWRGCAFSIAPATCSPCVRRPPRRRLSIRTARLCNIYWRTSRRLSSEILQEYTLFIEIIIVNRWVIK